MYALKRISIFMLVAVSFLTTLSSCRVTLAQQYNQTIVADVQDVMQSVSSLYINIQKSEPGDRLYSNYAGDYTYNVAKLDNISVSLKVLEKTEPSLKMVANAKALLLKFESEHKIKGTINAGQAESYNGLMQGALLPLLRAQLSLKPKIDNSPLPTKIN